jgi:hypothetical protein
MTEESQDIDWCALCQQLMKEGDQVTRYWFDSMHREDAVRRQRNIFITVAIGFASLAVYCYAHLLYKE